MSTILTTIRWLGIFAGALSLFYLGNAWFEFGLGEVFTHIYAWYASILHPVMELLKPVAVSVVAWLGFELPLWWKDGAVLYLALGGATARGSDSDVAVSRDELKSGDGYVYGYTAGKLRVIKIWDYNALWLPMRMVAWPVVWLWAVVTAVRQALRYGTRWSEHISKGYLGSSVWEFARIIAGAFLFAALNAGLG